MLEVIPCGLTSLFLNDARTLAYESLVSRPRNRITQTIPLKGSPRMVGERRSYLFFRKRANATRAQSPNGGCSQVGVSCFPRLAPQKTLRSRVCGNGCRSGRGRSAARNLGYPLAVEGYSFSENALAQSESSVPMPSSRRVYHTLHDGDKSQLSPAERATTSTTGVYSFYLAGQWLTSPQIAEVTSPFDGRVVGRVSLAQPEHVERAIQAAVTAFAVTRKLPAFERQKALAKIAAELTGRAEEFAQCISAEAGKPIRTARGEVERAAFCFQYAAEETTRLHGELLPLDAQAAGANRLGLLRRFPLGPVAAITPFNFPLNLVAHKMAPAMAAGCTMVLKPATQDSDGGADAGRRGGALGISAGGRQHSSHEQPDRGAADRGRALQAAHLYRILGGGMGAEGARGKEESCAGAGRQRGLHRALGRRPGQGGGAMRDRRLCLAGQSCISVQRILVERSVFEEFAAKLAAGRAEAAHGRSVRRADRRGTDDPSWPTPSGPSSGLPRPWARAQRWCAEASAAASVLAPTVLTGTTETPARELPGDLCAGGDRGGL